MALDRCSSYRCLQKSHDICPEADEIIYAAASQQFQKLVQEHIGSDLSVCGELVQPARSSNEPEPAAFDASCSCAAAGRECGHSSILGLSCGNCPQKRLNFLDSQGSGNVTCDEVMGRCLVDGQSAEVFSWVF
ncbi:unnamed protein product [Effrenium voratum]|nr:unnamed protein product [Effrenium voratum]